MPATTPTRVTLATTEPEKLGSGFETLDSGFETLGSGFETF